MQWSAFETRLRLVINDAEDGSEDWSDDTMALWANDGLALLWDLRPDCRVDDSDAEITLPTLTGNDDAQEMVVSDKWIIFFLLDYVAHRCFEQEGGDTEDLNWAKHHWEKAEAVLLGKM